MQFGKISATNAWNALLIAYRQRPGAHSYAADSASVDVRTASKAWNKGWPRHGLQPIRIALEVEREDAAKAEAKAKVEAMQATTEERLRSAREASEQSEREGSACRSVLSHATHLLAVSSRLHQAALPLVARLESALHLAALDADASGQPAKGVTLSEGVRLLREITKFTGQASDIAEQAMRLYRLHMGRPEVTLGVASLQELDPERAAVLIQEASEALRRSEGRKGLTVLDGGLGKRVG